MAHTLALTDEQLEQLERLVRAALSETHSELRRTRNVDFRSEVNSRLHNAEEILRQIEACRQEKVSGSES